MIPREARMGTCRRRQEHFHTDEGETSAANFQAVELPHHASKREVERPQTEDSKMFRRRR
jgi:hypothetical protein